MEIDTGGRIVGKKEIFFKIYHNDAYRRSLFRYLGKVMDSVER